MELIDSVFSFFMVSVLIACVFLLGFTAGFAAGVQAALDVECASECAPLPHAFVDGACGCVEVMED